MEAIAKLSNENKLIYNFITLYIVPVFNVNIAYQALHRQAASFSERIIKAQ